MSSYISHLTQLRCAHWTDPVAAFNHEQQQGSGRSGGSGKILADFDVLEEGFSVIKMCDKAVSGHDDNDLKGKQKDEEKLTDGVDWDTQMEFMDGEFESSLSDGNSSKTTIIVNFKGSIDIICCPIALESVEKMFDSLVSTFESLHPISVVNHLHSQSIGRVESRNTLKKEKSLDLQETSTVVGEPLPMKKMTKAEKKELAARSLREPDMFRTFEKSISSYVQVSSNVISVDNRYCDHQSACHQ